MAWIGPYGNMADLLTRKEVPGAEEREAGVQRSLRPLVAPDGQGEGGSTSPPSLTRWLYGPYIDLEAGTTPKGNPDTWGVICARNAMVLGDDSWPRLQGLYGAGYRHEIVRRSGEYLYDVDDPVDVSERQRSSFWNQLCVNLAYTDGQPEWVHECTLWLLNRLSMHDAVIRYGRSETPALRFIIGFSEVALDPANTGQLEVVADAADSGSWEGIESTYTLAALAAKLDHDVDRVKEYVARHEQHLNSVTFDRHRGALLWSRYHRVAAFIPHLEGDADETVAMLNRAESCATRLSLDRPEDALEARVVLSALWETRCKTAGLYGDLSAALSYALKYVNVAPLDPVAYRAVGNAQFRLGLKSRAAVSYLRAAYYGPPDIAESYFDAGQCFAGLGQSMRARDCYLMALGYEPDHAKSRNALLEVLPATDPLAEWLGEMP